MAPWDSVTAADSTARAAPDGRSARTSDFSTPARIGGLDLMPATMSNRVLRTVTRFCQSGPR
ncbi:hypothetical protein AB4Z54_23805, partial [Streptomyces sp. MCAF7]